MLYRIYEERPNTCGCVRVREREREREKKEMKKLEENSIKIITEGEEETELFGYEILVNMYR